MSVSQTSTRRRQGRATASRTSGDGPIEGSRTAASPESREPTSPFHFDLWLLFTVENWVLDFGRPIFALYVSDFFPLSKPSFGDYCHMAYNVITALCMLWMLDRLLRPIPKWLQYLLVIVFVMGASIHLVGDSVQHRLIHSGYQLHLSVQDNPIMKGLQPPSLIHSFELLDHYDEHLGHIMWYFPLYATFLLYFYGSFGKKSGYMLPAKGWLLLPASVVFEWYLVTEGQISVLFIALLVGMVATVALRHVQGLRMDANGAFLLYRTLLTLALVVAWVVYLWDDKTLREKYPGLLYVPEPWSYASLYLFKH